MRPPVEPRSCADWHVSRRALVNRGCAVLPIPAGALDGLATFERAGGLNRREVLTGTVGLIAMCTSLGACAGNESAAQAALDAAGAAHADDPDAPVLVSLYLDGGNDGLNTLVPLADPRYRKLRSRIAISEGAAIVLGDAPEFGWHPSLPGLANLYEAGKVAVLPAVDYANPDLSHFNSAHYWRTGIVGHAADPSGWLGRTLDLIGTDDNPLQGISVQNSLDPVLLPAHAPVATVLVPSDFNFWMDGVSDEQVQLGLLRDLAADRSGGSAIRASRGALRSAITTCERLRPLADGSREGSTYPASDLGQSLQSLARMLSAGFGTRVAAVRHGGGFDSHEEQPEQHAKNLADLDEALVAWQADLERRGLADRVLTLVWSEFGRRPADNESNGTDHGAGGLVLVVGNRANGGIRSEFPGLARLDPLENLLVTTPFRDVYASLLEGWMGVDAGRVLPGIGSSRIPLVRPL